MIARLTVTVVMLMLPQAAADEKYEFPPPVNTQAAGEHPPRPEEMPELFDLPPGFRVTLFAGEPDVQDALIAFLAAQEQAE